MGAEGHWLVAALAKHWTGAGQMGYGYSDGRFWRSRLDRHAQNLPSQPPARVMAGSPSQSQGSENAQGKGMPTGRCWRESGAGRPPWPLQRSEPLPGGIP